MEGVGGSKTSPDSRASATRSSHVTLLSSAKGTGYRLQICTVLMFQHQAVSPDPTCGCSALMECLSESLGRISLSVPPVSASIFTTAGGIYRYRFSDVCSNTRFMFISSWPYVQASTRVASGITCHHYAPAYMLTHTSA